MKKKEFSLVELSGTIAVVCLLILIFISNLLNVKVNAKETVTRKNQQLFNNSIQDKFESLNNNKTSLVNYLNGTDFNNFVSTYNKDKKDVEQQILTATANIDNTNATFSSKDYILNTLPQDSIASTLNIADGTPVKVYTNTFTSGPNLLIDRSEHTATLLNNGKVLITGGYNGTWLSECELYDPSTNTFTATGSLNESRAGHTATLLNDGKVLIVGGSASYINRTTAELYDPSTGTFSLVGNPQEGVRAHTSTLLPDGNVALIGGFLNSNVPTANIEIYNVTTKTFAIVNTMNFAIAEQACTLLQNGKLLITGGCDSFGNWRNTAELYDSSANTITSLPNMNSKRAFHTSTLLNNGKVLLTGISSGSSCTAELFDPTTSTFITTGDGNMFIGREWATGSLLQDGRVLIVGGYAGRSLGIQDTTEIYDPASGTFTMSNIMGTTRHSHAAVVLQDGSVFIIGGDNGSYLNLVDIFN